MYWLLSVSTSFVYATACLGWGLLLVALCRLDWALGNRQFRSVSNLAAVLASSFLAGFAINTAILTILGLFGLLRPWPLILVMLPGIIGLWWARQYRAEFIDAFYRASALLRNIPSWLIAVVWVVGILVFGLGVAAWFLPPEGDAAAYYLTYPKIMAATGWLEPMPGQYYYYSSISLPVELQYAALMVLADEHAAKFFMFPIGLAVAVMLAAIVRRCGGSIVAVTLAGAMLFSSYTFYHYIYNGKVEVVAAAFGLAALYWILPGVERGRQFATYIAAGWFAGLATVAKFSYLPALGVSLSVALVWQKLAGRTKGDTLKAAIGDVVRAGTLMTAAASIAWVPQLVKNSMMFSAPLAPFWGLAGSGDLLHQVWFSSEETRKILLTYPLALVFGRYPGQGGGLSLLYLAFLPFLIWFVRSTSWRGGSIMAVTAGALAGVVVWMILYPSVIAPRYLLATLLMFIPILALAAESVLIQLPKSSFLRPATTLTVLAALAASFWHLLPIPSTIAAGVSSKSNTCRLAAPECEVFSGLARTAQPNDRILIGSYHAYWLTPPQLQCRNTLEELSDIPDRDTLLTWLKKKGFTYVVVDPLVLRKPAADLRQLALEVPLEIEALQQGPVLSVYRIRSDFPAEVTCIETTDRRWRLQQKQL